MDLTVWSNDFDWQAVPSKIALLFVTLLVVRAFLFPRMRKAFSSETKHW
jgi:hypothetical protein